MDIERFNDHISQGIALMTEQKYEAAKKEFEAAISIDVKSYEAYIHLGNACANLGQFDDALSLYRLSKTLLLWTQILEKHCIQLLISIYLKRKD